MNIRVIDFHSIGNFHEVINFSVVTMCAEIFDRVTYISGKTASQNMHMMYQKAPQYYSDSISLVSHSVWERDSKLGFFVRIIWGFFVTLYNYLVVPGRDVVLYNYTNALSMPVILFLNIFLKKKIVFLMHGELELQYIDNISFFKPVYWYKLFHRLSFKYLVTKTPAVILVLGDSIKQNLCKLYPEITSNVISICHPYIIEDSFEPCKKKRASGPLQIGTVGLMTKLKGFDSLVSLAERFQEDIKNGKLIIKSIGKVSGVDMSSCEGIQWIGGDSSLPRDVFEDYIKQLDFILYLYPSSLYKLTASGAILDAIKMHKPIISLRNDYFDYLMDGGNNIGFLVNDIDEMVQVIKDGMKRGAYDFEEQFRSLRKKVSISYNAKKLKIELEKSGFIK